MSIAYVLRGPREHGEEGVAWCCAAGNGISTVKDEAYVFKNYEDAKYALKAWGMFPDWEVVALFPAVRTRRRALVKFWRSQ